MENLIKSFERYLNETLGIDVSPLERWQPESLPFFLDERYMFYRTMLMGRCCIVMVVKQDTQLTPATIHKHYRQVRQKTSEDVIVVQPSIPSHNRKRLIEYKVPFVVPGNQMYLPDLMIDLREYFISVRGQKHRFSPSAQAVILYILYNPSSKPYTPSKLAKKLGYANMTMTRALDEIKNAGLGEVSVEGRERWMRCNKGSRQLWKEALPTLKTPVKKEIWIQTLPNELPIYEAGETALSCYSMLAAPRKKVFAIGKKDWKKLERRDTVNELNDPDEAKYKLEVWNYSPKLFAHNKVVDKLSLFLSLKKTKDERVESALEKMMENMEWGGLEW